MNKTLVIIGNGFDVNHGYKTSARHFQANLDPSEYKTFEEKHLSMDWSSEDTPEWWWQYEQRVGEELVKIRIADDRLNFDTNSFTWSSFLGSTNEMYDHLSSQITDYLRREYSENIAASTVKKPILSQLFRHSNKIVAISFNHTETAKRYGINAYHIHGSLAEDNIVMGFDHVGDMRDYRECDISDVDEWPLIKRNKRYQRILMEYKRFSKKKGYTSRQITDGLEMLERYLDNRDVSLSGEPLSVNPDDLSYKLVLRFIKETKINLDNGLIPIIPYHDIKRIVVLGHSLNADQRLLDEIFSRCRYVRKVIIFRYEKETDDEWNEKVAYFKRLGLYRRHRKKRNRIKFVCEFY